MNTRKRIAFWLTLALGVLLAAEGLLRVLTFSSREIDALLSVEPTYAAVRDRALGWRGNPDYPEHDRLGFRNPDVPDDAAIVALGDSQTYGSQVEPDEAWPRQLERLGGGPTYNMAFPGWGPPQALVAFDEALDRKPELVLAAIYEGNDLVDSFTFVYHRKRETELRSQDKAVQRAIEQAEDADPWDDDPMADQMPTKFADPDEEPDPPETPEEFLAAYSKLYGLANAVRRAYDYRRRHPARPEADDENDPLKDDDYILLKTPRYRTVLTPSYREQAVDLDDARVDEGLRITARALVRMRDRAARAGVGFAVVLIPTKELALRNAAEANRPDLPPVYLRMVRDEEAARGRLVEELAGERIALVDTLPALRGLADGGELPYSDTKDGHLNARGQRAVAELVAATVERERLLTGASAAAPASAWRPE